MGPTPSIDKPIGKKHFPETKSWDDNHTISSRIKQSGHKVSRIEVIYEKMILGIQVFYKVPPYNWLENGEVHLGENINQKTKKKKEFILADDEYLIEIYGRCGSAIDKIGFVTSKRDLGAVGGDSGNSFRIRANTGHHFCTFKGGIGGYLDYLDVEQVVIPENSIEFNRLKERNYQEVIQESARTFIAIRRLCEKKRGKTYLEKYNENRMLAGNLSRQDFALKLMRLFPEFLEEKDFRDIFDDLDEKGTGQINHHQFNEFLKTAITQSELLKN